MDIIKVSERMWFDKDRKKLLPDNHKDAAFLYAAVGDEVPVDVAEKFGIDEKGKLKGKMAAALRKENTKVGAGQKSGARGANKQRAGGEDKSGQKGGDKSGTKSEEKQAGGGAE
jgi:hypothetical protein